MIRQILFTFTKIVGKPSLWKRIFQERVHVRIVPIGVGFQVSEEELDVMSSGGHYVLVDRFEDLANALYDVMDLVCTW